jgi:hypothetical protein
MHGPNLPGPFHPLPRASHPLLWRSGTKPSLATETRRRWVAQPPTLFLRRRPDRVLLPFASAVLLYLASSSSDHRETNQQPGSPRRHLPTTVSASKLLSTPAMATVDLPPVFKVILSYLWSHPRVAFSLPHTDIVVAPDPQTWAMNTISSSSFRYRIPQISGEQNLLLPRLSHPHTQI